MGAVVAVPAIVWGHLVVHRVLRHLRSRAGASGGKKRGRRQSSDKSPTIDAALLTVFAHGLPHGCDTTKQLVPLDTVSRRFSASTSQHAGAEFYSIEVEKKEISC
jgi:hypothetical protein